MQDIGWVVWCVFLFILLITGIIWLFKQKQYPTENYYNTTDVITLVSVPKIMFFEIILLVLFLLIDISKLHLLWLFPIIWLAVTMKMAKKIMKRDGLIDSDDTNIP